MVMLYWFAKRGYAIFSNIRDIAIYIYFDRNDLSCNIIYSFWKFLDLSLIKTERWLVWACLVITNIPSNLPVTLFDCCKAANNARRSTRPINPLSTCHDWYIDSESIWHWTSSMYESVLPRESSGHAG